MVQIRFGRWAWVIGLLSASYFIDKWEVDTPMIGLVPLTFFFILAKALWELITDRGKQRWWNLIANSILMFFLWIYFWDMSDRNKISSSLDVFCEEVAYCLSLKEDCTSLGKRYSRGFYFEYYEDNNLYITSGHTTVKLLFRRYEDGSFVYFISPEGIMRPNRKICKV